MALTSEACTTSREIFHTPIAGSREDGASQFAVAI